MYAKLHVRVSKIFFRHVTKSRRIHSLIFSFIFQNQRTSHVQVIGDIYPRGKTNMTIAIL